MSTQNLYSDSLREMLEQRENISYPHNFHDRGLVKTAVMSAIGAYKRANGIEAATVESSVSY